MNASRTLLSLGPALLAVFALAACEGVPGTTESDSEEVDQAAEPVQQAADPEAAEKHEKGDRAHKRHGRGGPDSLIHSALELDGLSAAQTESIKGLLERRDPPKDREGEPGAAAFFAELAKQVRAGKVDVSSLPAQPEPKDYAGKHAAFAERLQKLHGILSADQRQALVAEVQAKEPTLGGRPPKADADHDGPRGKGHKKGGLGKLLFGLDVTDEQRDKIEAALAQAGLSRDKADFKGKHEAMKAQRDAMLQAFAQDGFDAKTALTPPKDKGLHLNKMAESMAVVVPLLTAEQRETLAERIEQGPKHKGFGPGKMKQRQKRGASGQ